GIVAMRNHHHAGLVEKFHKRRRVLQQKLSLGPGDARQRKMRVGGSPPESRKMLRAGNNIAFRKLLDDRGRETRHCDWIRRQTSFSADRSRQPKLRNGSQIEIETGGLELCGCE